MTSDRLLFMIILLSPHLLVSGIHLTTSEHFIFNAIVRGIVAKLGSEHLTPKL